MVTVGIMVICSSLMPWVYEYRINNTEFRILDELRQHLDDNLDNFRQL